MKRRCSFCGKFSRIVILVWGGQKLAWSHQDCARRAGMWALKVIRDHASAAIEAE